MTPLRALLLIVLALIGVMFAAAMSNAQGMQHYIIRSIDPVQIEEEAPRCAKDGGLGANVFTLDGDGNVTSAEVACLIPVKD